MPKLLFCPLQFHDWVVKMETLFRRPSPAGNPKLDELDRQTGLLIRQGFQLCTYFNICVTGISVYL